MPKPTQYFEDQMFQEGKIVFEQEPDYGEPNYECLEDIHEQEKISLTFDQSMTYHIKTKDNH